MNKYLSFIARVGRPGPADAKIGSATPSLRPPVGVQFIPGEDVLLLSVTLPKMSPAQRRAAVAFAVEDHIARPLEEVHVAIGPELAPNQWLVGIVARTALPAITKAHLRILPDTLALPVPPPGNWALWQENGRVLIRLPDGMGLVTNPNALPILHQIAGAPAITLYAGQIALDHSTGILPPISLPPQFDLTDRQTQAFKVPPLARRLATIAGIAALGHLAILAADTASLARQQTALMTKLRAAADAPPEANNDDILARILAPAPSAPEAGFLPLLSTTFAAIADQTGSVTLRDLRFAAVQRSLTLTLQAPDLGTLQQVETNLAAASLAVTAGPATNANGTAEQQLTVQGPPA